MEYIEQFNDHYQQKFLGKVIMTSTDELTCRNNGL